MVRDQIPSRETKRLLNRVKDVICMCHDTVVFQRALVVCSKCRSDKSASNLHNLY